MTAEESAGGSGLPMLTDGKKTSAERAKTVWTYFIFCFSLFKLLAALCTFT
jgi:hypothetical protein